MLYLTKPSHMVAFYLAKRIDLYKYFQVIIS